MLLHPTSSLNDVKESAEAALDMLLIDLAQHPVFSNPYFDLLRSIKWNAKTFEIHRANFFYRTDLTVKAIAQTCARAALHEDTRTLILFSHILNEECGNGNPLHCHATLMEQSHNLFGSTEFDVAPLLSKEAKNSPLILEETRQYRDKLQALVNDSYQCMLGALMFLEMHAEKMLLAFRAAFRLNHQYMEASEYRQKVEVYFNCHLDNGVEERHAQDARQCVLNNYYNNHDFAEIKNGVQAAAQVQLNMWNAVYKEVTAMQPR